MNDNIQTSELITNKNCIPIFTAWHCFPVTEAPSSDCQPPAESLSALMLWAQPEPAPSCEAGAGAEVRRGRGGYNILCLDKRTPATTQGFGSVPHIVKLNNSINSLFDTSILKMWLYEVGEFQVLFQSSAKVPWSLPMCSGRPWLAWGHRFPRPLPSSLPTPLL